MITKKQILYLIAIAIILVIVSVACKKKPTNAADYMVVKQAEQSPQPEKKLTIDTNQGLIQFKDLSFKSGAYYINGNYTRKIYYYADVKVDENSKPYISAITKSEDGEIIEDEGKFYETSTNESGEFYNLEGVRYQSGNMLTAEATFTESGYLIIRFSNYSLDITYSLLNEKAPEEIVDEISDGTYIPKIYVGTYEQLFWGAYNASVATNLVCPGAAYYYITNATYLGNNTWHWDFNNSDDYQIIYQVYKNEKGQRVLKSIEYKNRLGECYTNTQIHLDDVNK